MFKLRSSLALQKKRRKDIKYIYHLLANHTKERSNIKSIHEKEHLNKLFGLLTVPLSPDYKLFYSLLIMT